MTGSMKTESGDARVRERIRGSLDESLIVEAAAGTGKTSELVHRIVAVLGSGRTRVDRIVAVTFTRKAAGELKLRLRQELDQARNNAQEPAELASLEQAMVRLEEAHIGTIHSFCADILHERPVEASIQPGFEELDEKQAPRLFARAFSKWIQERLSNPPPGLRRALSRAASWAPNRSPLGQIENAAWRLVEWRDFPRPWRREEFSREEEIDALVDQVVELSTMVSSSRNFRDPLRQALRGTIDFRTRVERAEAVRKRDYDDLEAVLVRLGRDLKWNRKKGRGKFSDDCSRQQVLDRREQLLERLNGFQIRAEADLASLLRDELWGLVERYDEAKTRAGKVDFVDLLLATRNLIRDDGDVRGFLQGRFTHIFVDEFQDTDPLQAEILLLLASDNPREADWLQTTPVPGKLFLVGDPKQSIYRFRRADVVLYRSLRERLTSRGVGLLYLTKSFRAVPDIQKAVNAAFATVMDGDPITGQPSYVPLDPHSAPIGGQPSVIALPVGHPYGWYRVTKKAVEEGLPDTVAAFIEWLLNESGWRVRNPDKPGEEIPVSSRHVCILFRRFLSWGKDITRGYVHALETRNIPHLLWGAKSFHQREEVETIRAALTAIEWPDDELSVYATLKGSLFAIPDPLLLRYRHSIGSLHPFRKRFDDVDPEFEPIAEALNILAGLHRRRNWQPFVETLNELLESSRAHAAFALRPAGNQILANVYRVGDLARSFEARAGSSFRGFVDQLTSEAATEDAAEAPVLEEGAEGVRIMTVHAAKGLEFPIVILADITANLAAASADKHVDPKQELCAMRILGCSPWELQDHTETEHRRDEAEGARVAYVAATRARDLLVVSTVGDEPMEGWVGCLNKALYPADASRRSGGTAPGCPEFGDRSVLERPANLMTHDEYSVQPGLHRPQAGELDVVWWDPAQLDLDVEGNFGLRQEEILKEDPHGRSGDESEEAYRSWTVRREKRIESGSQPRFEVFTATEALTVAPDGAGDIRVLEVDRAKGRPSGTRFGTLVHQVLRDVSFTASRKDIESLAALHARLFDAPEEEVHAAINAVSNALKHPFLGRVQQAERVHRELPVTLPVENARILEGVIDLVFLDDDTWNVVDFKTDADIASSLEHYRLQVGWYMYAMTRITGRPCKGYLLSL